MSWTPVNGLPIQYSNSNNELASDYWLKLYDAGTTNPYSMATDSTGAVRLSKCKLNYDGYPITDYLDNDSVFVPHIDQNYRAILYISEADADADNTANVAYNVDNLLPDATVAADISQITTRGTTLQAQDDYDRSPLFVDGIDFTAGLGPHIITVPVQVPAWTPNAADTRFYKLSSSGAVTTPDVTSSDATTFTLSDTLLSTDVLFIGDDNFRNQIDGDPSDIRTRLDVYSTSEAQAAPSAVTSFTSNNTYYKSDTVLNMSILNLTKGLFQTVGPTGSGADYEWSDMDNIPLSAKSIDLAAYIQSDSAGGNTQVGVWLASSQTAYIAYQRIRSLTGDLTRASTAGSLVVPLDGSNLFTVMYSGVGASETYTGSIYLTGFYD